MTRQARIVVPGIPMHIVQRGNARMACFREERDYLVFMALVQEASHSAECRLHAYCLMPNHVHLLVTPVQPVSSAKMMSALCQRYSRFFNNKYRRTGTLWESRFRSCLVDSDQYLLACHRYIEMNPVRAGLANRPADYPWSSCAGNSGLREDSLLTPHPQLKELGFHSYVGMLSDVLEPTILEEIRRSTAGGYPFGGSPFKEMVEKQTVRPIERRRPGPKTKVERSVTVTELFG
jgi:putative transposase